MTDCTWGFDGFYVVWVTVFRGRFSTPVVGKGENVQVLYVLQRGLANQFYCYGLDPSFEWPFVGGLEQEKRILVTWHAGIIEGFFITYQWIKASCGITHIQGTVFHHGNYELLLKVRVDGHYRNNINKSPLYLKNRFIQVSQNSYSKENWLMPTTISVPRMQTKKINGLHNRLQSWIYQFQKGNSTC